MDAVFDEAFTSPLVLPDLPYQGAIRLRNVSTQIPNQDLMIEYTDAPSGESETFPEDLGLPNPTRNHTTADISDLVSRPKRGKGKQSYSAYNTSTDKIHTNIDDEHKLHAYFTNMSRPIDPINYAEYLNMAHEQQTNMKNNEKTNDHIINLSDYIPEPKSLQQVTK